MKKQIGTFRSGLILACALLTTAGYICPRAFSEEANSSPGAALQHPIAAVFRFAVQSASATDATPLSLQACRDNAQSAADGTAAQNNLTVDPLILDAISDELQQKLSKKMSVMVDPDPNTVPVGALTINGCVFQADKGNKAERMIGLGLGASWLGAHVVLLTKTETGFAPVDSFDVQVKGRAILPPAGPAGVAVHAAKEFHETLTADAKKLADQIVKKLNNDMGQQAS